MARIDATLKSYLGNPLTGLVYAASLAIGAISILAMYESPLSPLPVPSLPKPPVGRFPPEHPSWPPIPKHAVKMKAGAGPYAASQVNPVYALAPFQDQKAAVDESNWFAAQNMVSQYAGQMSPPRRNDHVHAAQLQSYITHMSKLPVIRSKSGAEFVAASSTTASPHNAAVASAAAPASLSPEAAVAAASSPSSNVSAVAGGNVEASASA